MFPMKFKVNMLVKMPFLTNKADLVRGELLVLPYDGGCEEIFSVPPSMSASSQGYEPTQAQQ